MIKLVGAKMNNENNMALKAFIKASKNLDIQLPEEVLIKIYEIEERNQFKKSSERGNVNKEIEKLILSSTASS